MAIPVFLICMSVGTVFGIGGTSVISRALGEGKMDYARKACSFCMWSRIAVGVAMSALFLTFMDQILVMMGTSADTYDFAKTYLTTVALSGPFILIANCYSYVTHHYIKHKKDPDFDLATFSKSVGHSSIRTTMEIYAHLDMTQNRFVQRSIDDLKDF